MKRVDILKKIKRCMSVIKYDDSISENYWFIAQRSSIAQGNIEMCKESSFPNFELLRILLERYGYEITEKELCNEIKALSMTDAELKMLHSLIVFCCILAIADGKKRAEAIGFLDRSGYFDYGAIYQNYSELQRMLLTFPDYKKSNASTRALYVEYLERYAKKNKTTSIKALRQIPQGSLTQILMSGQHRISKKLYFPLIIAITVMLAISEGVLIFKPFSYYAVAPFIFSLFPLYECSVYLVNYSYSRLFSPKVKMSLRSDCLPGGVKTLAVITTLIDGDGDEALQKIEQYYISNKYDGLLCGILADLPDSDKAYSEKDEQIISALSEKIKALCEKYGDVFFLFYRGRRYSITQGRFIAPERKRGAVLQMCRLLYTGQGDINICGNAEALSGVKYLITLDFDTVMMPHTARRLTCVMEHPANKAVFDASGRIVRGHGILQPCVDTVFVNGKSAFSLMSSGNGGVQSYSNARFDIYEEIFKKGIFCGKGIINCEAFYKAVYGVLPDEKILSHDVVEGCMCNAGMIPDISFYDTTPSNALSYYKRLERWVRGDVQTYVSFCGKYIKKKNEKIKNPLNSFDKYKLFDNVRRDLVPFFAVLAMICASLAMRHICTCIAVFSLFYLGIPMAVSLFECLYSGAFGVKRKFYSFTVSQFWYNILFLLFRTVSLGYDAYIGISACIRSLWRLYVSGEHLLDWVCASKAEKSLKGGFLSYLIKGAFSVVTGVFFLLFVPYGIYRSVGLCLALSPVVLYILKKSPKKDILPAPTQKQRKAVERYAGDMWRYFEYTVNSESNYLPVDNVSYISGEKIAYHTSPTNIGMYLMSVIAAYDFALIDAASAIQRIEKTVSTVEHLKKYKGNLYNWYDVRTVNTLSDFVSFVDSGNFLCALVCVEAALMTLDCPRSLLQRIRRIIDSTDLACMYDESACMFYIGIDEKNGVTANNHYDIYMSEARTGDYLAFAMGKINSDCLSNTHREVISQNGYIGLASWTGTAFEYFMPSLFLPRMSGSLENEALKFAYRIQRQNAVRCADKPYVYGMSESCYFELDGDMNYQYKAHGSQQLGLKNGLWEDTVISPYSSFLMLCMSGDVLKNLAHLERYGAYGNFGFYEAVDFTKSRIGGGFALVRCYMSHHIGMSMVAAANFIFDGIFVKRFTSDIYIKSSLYSLYEKIPTEQPPYKHRKNEQSNVCELVKHKQDQSCCIISNGLCRLSVSNGNISLDYGDICISENEKEYGKLRLFSDINGKSVCINEGKCVCSDDVSLFNADNIASASMTVSGDKSVFCIDASAPCADSIRMAFAPVMTSRAEYVSHISYSRLFVTVKCENGILIYRRKKNNKQFYVCISAIENGHSKGFEYRCENNGRYYPSNENTEFFCPVTPIAEICVKGEKTCFLISCGYDLQRAIEQIYEISNVSDITQRNKEQISQLNKTVFHNGFYSDDVMYAYLNRTYRPSVKTDKSFYGVHTLWKYGISADNPIMVLDIRCEYLSKVAPFSVLTAVATHKSMLIKGAKYDTVILYTENNEYNRENEQTLKHVLKSMGALSLLNQKNGIFLVRCDDEKEKELFSDISFYPHIPHKSVLHGEEKSICVESDNENIYDIVDGSVRIAGPLLKMPWSYVYANERFGTLVMHNSLGYSWYGNSRMGKLTEHTCDVLQYGAENIYLECDGELYDVLKCCEKTVFHSEQAEYIADVCGLRITVQVCCDAKYPEKHVCVKITNFKQKSVNCEICYKADIICGENARSYGALSGMTTDKLLCVTDVYGNMPDCLLYSDKGSISEFNGRSGALRCLLKIKALSSCKIEYTFGVRHTHISRSKIFDKEAQLYKKALDEYLDVYVLETSDKDLDMMFNKFAKYQSLYCRVYARCGFYQTSGAFGFRDQLQDMLCVMYSYPEYAREHILLCAAHQYLQGDVMHWWHPDPSKEEMGIRTRISDDLLWLPFVVERYIRITGDETVLFTPVSYLSSPSLEQWENDRYEKAEKTVEKESLYAHCVRALNASLTFGQNGLPLFKSGDWNDGMNNVKGESVWLGWFMCSVLDKMAYMADIAKDSDGKKQYTELRRTLMARIEDLAFNGKYYIRGTYSDGAVLGDNNTGCDVDLIVQAFAAMYGEDEKRKLLCMKHAEDVLYDKENGILRLFYPPFDDSDRYSGYICDYPPGIRENGGQYTHGAIWGAMGFFHAGMNDTAYSVLKIVNPLVRYESKHLAEKYKGESYVLAADIYDNSYSRARCGWTWYTASASWYFVAVLEGLLGYEENDGKISAHPRYCKDFSHFKLTVKKNSKIITVTGKKGHETKITSSEA